MDTMQSPVFPSDFKDPERVYIEIDKKRLIFVNVCNLTPKVYREFMDYYLNAVKTGVNALEVVEVWNMFAKSVHEYVFIRRSEAAI